MKLSYIKSLLQLPDYIYKIVEDNFKKPPEYKAIKEPKIAFCLYGVVGNIKGKAGRNKSSSKKILKIGFNHYKKHIFNKNKNVDIFIHTWSKDLEKEIRKLYKPKATIFQKQIIFEIPKHVEGNDQRKQSHYSRWYSTKKVIELKSKYERKNNFKYDMVMLSRFDIAWQKDLFLKNFDPRYFYAAKTYSENIFFKLLSLDIPIGYPYTKNWPGICDLWFFSNSENINKLSTLFNNLNKITKADKEYPDKHKITSHFLVHKHLKKTRLINKLRLIFKHSGYSTLKDEIDPLIRRKYFNDII